MARASYPSQMPPNRRTPAWLRAVRWGFVALVLILILFGYQIAALYTDYLWFGELGQTGVFRTALGAKLTLFFGFGLLFFLVCYFNLWLARRMNLDRPRVRLLTRDREELAEHLQRGAHAIGLGAAIVLAFMVGGNASSNWSSYLLFTHGGAFGAADPVFHNDVGFYVFRLPFLGYLQGWLLFTLVVSLIGAALMHVSQGAIDFTAPRLHVPDFARRHAFLLLGLCALAWAWGIWLGRYGILYSDNGAFFGAGYTDLHARLPAAVVETVVAALVGIVCFVAAYRSDALRWPLFAIGGWVVVAILMGGIYPAILQTYSVTPNQQEKERPYIANDIRSTRMAYNLTDVQTRDFPADTGLTTAQLAANGPTINSIRLWDWPELGAVYNARQALRSYYQFDLPQGAASGGTDFNIDVDRYHFGADYRQVMLGARELNPNKLPAGAQTWQNRHLQYTHGYGAVMSPVNVFGQDGLPDYYMSQMPVQVTHPELQLTRPEVYYGELATGHVFVDTKVQEFDYPQGDVSQKTRYEGKGGVPLGGLSKLAWATRLGDTNMLLSSDLTDSSRVLFRRNIRDRVTALAPFLNWDRDFYLVVDSGRLKWIGDGYTTTSQYPYSKPTFVGTGAEDTDQSFNYIRNSVKAVIDAYDGAVTFYVADAKDPMITTWGRIFPGLFHPLAEMPTSLKAHLRYPEDLFRIQRDIYTLYHITDPTAYYLKEDAWTVPLDPTEAADSENGAPPPMAPYYVVMKLPGQTSEEFLLMTPYTPLSQGSSGQNLAAWMCARCDPDDYGKLLVYRFPRGSNVNGPQQVMALIRKQPDVSELQTLLGQSGSKIIFGNLLIIPVDNSLLYVVPLYVQSSGTGAVPGVNQVILASGNTIVMRPSLNEAVTALGAAGGAPATATAAAPSVTTPPSITTPPTPGAAPGATTTAAPPSGPLSPAEALRRANAAYARARQQQKAYNASLDDLGRALKDLQGSLGPRRP